MRREITKAKTTEYCFPHQLQQSSENGTTYDVGSGLGGLLKYYERHAA
jgi:hypothetical protein